METARRIVVSDSVAGEVRRYYQDQDSNLTISSPYAYDKGYAERVSSYYVYIDATSSDPQIALDAANRVAEKAVAVIEETIPSLKKVTVYEEAILRGSSTGDAAEPGVDAIYTTQGGTEGAVVVSLSDRISKMNVLLALIVGLFGSAFCFCAYEILSRKIRTAHDVEALIGIPVIAQLSSAEDFSNEDSKRELGITISDAQVFLAKEGKQIIGVGSIAEPELSKKFAHALTETLKKLGLKVALIAGEESEPISLAGLQKRIEKLEIENDYVVLDAGAFSVSPDAAASIAASDVVLLATQAHQASNKQIKKTIQQLQIADVPLLGIVLFAGKPKAFWKA